MLIYYVLLQLDSATSLITAAKNLMNAVISTVKASYVANTKVWLVSLLLSRGMSPSIS